MSREDNIYFARLAEQGERYEDMINYMKKVSNVSHSLPCLFVVLFLPCIKFQFLKALVWLNLEANINLHLII